MVRGCRLLQLAEPEGEPARMLRAERQGRICRGDEDRSRCLKTARLPSSDGGGMGVCLPGGCSYQSLLRPIGGTPREVCLVLAELPGSSEAVWPTPAQRTGVVRHAGKRV